MHTILCLLCEFSLVRTPIKQFVKSSFQKCYRPRYNLSHLSCIWAKSVHPSQKGLHLLRINYHMAIIICKHKTDLYSWQICVFAFESWSEGRPERDSINCVLVCLSIWKFGLLFWHLPSIFLLIMDKYVHYDICTIYNSSLKWVNSLVYKNVLYYLWTLANYIVY